MADALREVFAHFGVTVDTKPLEDADKGVSALIGQLRQLGAVVAGGALVARLTSFVDGVTNAVDGLVDSAARLQVSTDALQELRYAAKLSGVEAGEMDAAIAGLTRQLQGLSEGADGPAKILRKLGVEAKDSKGNLRTFSDLLPEIADGIAEMPNDTERAGAAMRLFGRNGMALLPLLKMGREGLEELKAEFHDLGGGVSAEAAQAMAEYRDQVDRADVAMESFKTEVVLGLLPAFRFISDVGRRVSAVLTDISRRTHLLDVAFGLAGAALTAWAIKTAIALAPVLAPVLAIAAGVTAIIVALDDLWTTFEGGESAIQLFIDEMYGLGTTAELVDGLIMLWDDLVTSILEAGQAAKEFLGFGKAEPVEDRGQRRARERYQAQESAVEAGDVQAFAKARQRAGVTNAQGIQGEFLERRRKAIAEGRVKANANDIAAGLADKNGKPRAAVVALPEQTITSGPSVSVGQLRVGALGRQGVLPPPAQGKGGTTVDARTTVQLVLPPGSDRDAAERMRRAAEQVFNEQTRAAQAALLGTTNPGVP